VYPQGHFRVGGKLATARGGDLPQTRGRHLKTSDYRLRAGAAVKSAWIDAQRSTFVLTKLCALLEVSVSGDRAWNTGGKSDRTGFTDHQRLALIESFMPSFRAPMDPRAWRERSRYGASRPARNGWGNGGMCTISVVATSAATSLEDEEPREPLKESAMLIVTSLLGRSSAIRIAVLVVCTLTLGSAWAQDKTGIPARALMSQEQYALAQLIERLRHYQSNWQAPSSLLALEVGISDSVLKSLVARLDAFAQGSLLSAAVQCEGKTFGPLVSSPDKSLRKERISRLQAVGARLFWAAQDLDTYADFARNPDKVTVVQAPLVCDRIELLHTQLRCLTGETSCASIDAMVKALQVKPSGAMHLVNGQLAEFKALLFPYMNRILAELAVPESRLAELLANPNGKGDELQSALLAAIASEILDGEAIRLYEAYTQLAPEIVQTVESDPTFKALASDAKAAYQAIKPITTSDVQEILEQAGRYTAADPDIIAAKKMVATFAEQAVTRIVELNPQIQAVLDAVKTTAQLASDTAKAAAEEACRRLEEISESTKFGRLQWGEIPNADGALGYRFTAVDTKRTKRIDGVETSLYRARLELLVGVGVEGISYAAKEIDGFADCNLPESAVVRMRALDLGIAIEDVYRGSDGRFRYSIGPRNVIEFNPTTFRNALNRLGIPGDWLNSRPEVRITEDLRTVTFEVDIYGSRVDLPVVQPVVQKGSKAFDLRPFKEALCDQLTSHILPDRIRAWGGKLELPLGATLTVDTGAELKLDYCDALDKTADGQSPRDDASLTVLTHIQLEGEIDGTKFKWPGSASLRASPSDVKLRTLTLGDVPEPLAKALEVRVQNLLEDLENPIIRFSPPSLVTDGELAIEIPFLVALPANECLMESVPGSWRISPKETRLSSNVDPAHIAKQLRDCARDKLLKEVVKNCEQQADGALFGFPAVIEVESRENNRCALRAELTIGVEKVLIKNIILDLGNGGKIDLSEASVSLNIDEALKSELESTLGVLAKKGVEIDEPKFEKGTLYFNLVVKAEDPFGTIDFGRISVSADGKLDDQLEEMFKNRVSQLLGERLEKIARTYLPDDIENFHFEEFTLADGKPSIRATFDIRFSDDILLPGKVTLLPMPPSIDTAKMEELLRTQFANVLGKLLGEATALGNSLITIKEPRVEIDEDYNLRIITGASLNLAALGELGVDKIYIMPDRVEFGGRIEYRSPTPIPIIPAPVPVFVALPGLFFDPEIKETGIVGSISFIAPGTEYLFQIDGRVSTIIDEKFLDALKLSGEVILVNALPLQTAEGLIDFRKATITYQGGSSGILKAILDASTNGSIRLPDKVADFESRLVIFGADLARTSIDIDVEKCPSRCIKANADFNLLIGSGRAETEFGPFIVDARLVLGIKLSIFGREEIFGKPIGSGSIEASLARAALTAKVLDIFSITVRTPGLEEMTPAYLAAILASLLEIDLEDLLKWLENPTFKLEPAGSPGGSDGGTDGGDHGDDSRQEQQSGTPAASKPSVSDSPPKASQSVPPQRTRIAGNHVRACKDRDWGTVDQSSQLFHSAIGPLSDHVYGKVCADGTPDPNGAMILREDNYLPLRTFDNMDQDVSGLVKSEGEKVIERRDPSYEIISSLTDEEMKTRVASDIVLKLYDYIHKFKPPTMIEHSDKFSVEESLMKRLEKVGASSDQGKVELKQAVFYSGELGYHRPSTILDVSKASNGLQIKYETTVAGTTGYDKAVIWVNKEANKAVFQHNCYSSPRSQPVPPTCVSVEGVNTDRRLLDELVKNEIPLTSDGSPTILLGPETAWVVNDLVPRLITERTTPSRGARIHPDEQVANCSVESIEALDLDDNVRFRVRRSKLNGQRTVYVSVDFQVSKTGAHATWSANPNSTLARTMVSFLACEQNPGNWLQQHEQWLPPQGDTLFYQPAWSDNSAYIAIQEFRPASKPVNFNVIQHDPYAGLEGIPHDLSDKAKTEILTHLGQGSYANTTVTIALNAESRLEVLVQENASGVVVTRRALSSSGVVFEQKGSTPTTIPHDALEQCMSDLRIQPKSHDDGTGLLAFLALESPAVQTGIGAAQLIRVLEQDPNVQCGKVSDLSSDRSR
jgi:hypothetical protein